MPPTSVLTISWFYRKHQQGTFGQNGKQSSSSFSSQFAHRLQGGSKTALVISILILLAFPWQLVSSDCPIFDRVSSTQPRNHGNLAFPDRVSLGVILPKGLNHLPYRFELVYPAVTIAVDKMMESPYVLPGVNITLKDADSKCSDEYGPMAAIDMFLERSVHAFLGPACSYAVAPVARYSYCWGIPILTAGGLYSHFSKKTDFKLLTGVQGNYIKSAEFVISVLQHFNFTRAGWAFALGQSGGFEDPLGSNDCLQIIKPIYYRLSRLSPNEKMTFTKINETEEGKWEEHLKKLSNSSRSEYPHHHLLLHIRLFFLLLISSLTSFSHACNIYHKQQFVDVFWVGL